MTTTTILAAIGATVLILQTATRLPPALADLLRSLRLVRDALHDLRTPSPSEGFNDGMDFAHEQADKLDSE